MSGVDEPVDLRSGRGCGYRQRRWNGMHDVAERAETHEQHSHVAIRCRRSRVE